MASAEVITEETGNGSVPSPLLTDKEHRALKLFELAEEKEVQGLLSDSVKFYREATRLCHNVEAIYRKQHLPLLIDKLKQERGKNATRRVNEEEVKKINVDALVASFEFAEPVAPDPNDPEHAEEGHMIIKLGNLTLEESKISPLLKLHDDVWFLVMETLIVQDPESWFNFSMTCKKNAYLGFGKQFLWKAIWDRIYPYQVYEGMTKEMKMEALYEKLALHDFSYKNMLKKEPYIRFGGVYISVVHYYSEGGRPEFSNSWTNPVRTITYYRYLRFYRDGRCLMLLTHLEPKRVVPYIQKNQLFAIPRGDSKAEVEETKSETSRIYKGTWALDESAKLRVVITSGPSKDYVYHYTFSVGGMAHYHHGKLNWEDFQTVRKRVEGDDPWREGEVSLLSMRKEKPFKFLKVRSYKLGLE